MYRRVPPPEQGVSPSSGTLGGEGGGRDFEDEGKQPPRPASISQEHWKKFQDLKVRREQECGKHASQRKSAVRNQALKAVSREFTLVDKAILEEEGASLPEQGRGRERRKRRKRKLKSPVDGERGGDSESQVRVEVEEEWQTVRKYINPNSQLRGMDKGRHTPKSGLEEEMDSAIEKREFEEAAAMNDRLAQREFATQVTTAFDCHKFVKRRKVEEERKRTKKLPQLQWSFEHKQRWESKGNM